MAENCKDTKYTKRIYRRVHFVRNAKNFKIHNIYWCEGGLKLADISTKNVVDNHLNPRMKYITLRLHN